VKVGQVFLAALSPFLAAVENGRQNFLQPVGL
jgi:hypothetical protein